jgi:hypothetical protein
LSNIFSSIESDTSLISFIPHISVDPIILSLIGESVEFVDVINKKAIIDIFGDLAKIVSISSDSKNKSLYSSTINCISLSSGWILNTSFMNTPVYNLIDFEYGYIIGNESGPIIDYDKLFGYGDDIGILNKISNSIKTYNTEIHKKIKDLSSNSAYNNKELDIKNYYQAKINLLDTCFNNFVNRCNEWATNVSNAKADYDKKKEIDNDLKDQIAGIDKSISSKKDEIKSITQNAYLYGG